MSSATTSTYASSIRSGIDHSRSRAPTLSLVLKECRQIAPLFWSLLAIGFFLHLLGAINAGLNPERASDYLSVHQAALSLMPIFFAIGTGAVLVSQEKELRTLYWLAGLPIDASKIVWIKTLVALVGLILFWLFSVVISLVFEPNTFQVAPSYLFVNQYTFPMYVAYSIFLLVASFAMAWIFDSAWIALFALGVTTIGLLFAYATSDELVLKVTRRRDAYGINFACHLGVTVIATGGIVGLGYYFGRRSFVAPGGAPRLEITTAQIPQILRVEPSDGWQTKAPWTGLLWQISHQNAMLWIAVGGGILSLISIPFLFVLNFHVAGTIVIFGYIPAALLASWLGASTFGSDNAKGRIRFLADRGIAPGLVWRSRILLPAAIIACYLIGAVVAIATLLIENNASYDQILILCSGLCLFGLLIFSATQWSSLWTRSTFLAMCLAPAVAVAIVAYCSFAVAGFGATPGLIVISALVMLLASRVMMRSWMDGRTGMRIALQHIGFGALTLAIPLLPTLWIFATSPAMSRSTRADLWSLAGTQALGAFTLQNALSLRTVDELQDESMGFGEAASVEKPKRTSLVFLDRTSRTAQLLNGIEYQLNTSNNLNVEDKVRSFLIGELKLTSAELNEDTVEESQLKALQARYKQLVRVLVRVANLERHSGQIDRNEHADIMEKLLVEELSKPHALKNLDQATYNQIAEKLSDSAGRNDLRRKAIATTWMWQDKMIQTSQGTPDSLGKIPIPRQAGFGLVSENVLMHRRVGLAAEVLLQFLDSGNRQADNPAFKRYADFWKTDRLVMPEKSFFGEGNTVPGLLWHADWETQAKKLLSQSEQPTTTE